MYALILAGGSGTRLWPLSREFFPKQYLSFGRDRGSLFQETVNRVAAAVPPEKLLVVTHREQLSEIKRQLAEAGHDPGTATLLGEPQMRNTAPAVGLGAWFLAKSAGPEAVMAVLPSDHYITDREQFAALLLRAAEAARAHGLVTFGIEPTYPETGYGYIRRGEPLDGSAFRVDRFVEKPAPATAASYLEDGRYLWNSGIFVFQVGPLLEAYRRHLPEMAAALDKIDFADESSIEEAYAQIEPISIDYGIMEQVTGAAVIPTAIPWSDVGSFAALHQILPKDEAGNYCEGRTLLLDSRDNLVISRSRLIGAAGLEKMAVVETADALLVCPLERSQEVRALAGELAKRDAPERLQHSTVHRPWGSFTTLELGQGYQVKRIAVAPGKRLSLQSHRHRAENWIVVRGTALVTVAEETVSLSAGERAFIPIGAKHRLENPGAELLEVIEVQSGAYLGEDDIIRYEDDFGRVAEAGPDSPQQCYQRWLDHPGLDPGSRRLLEAMAGESGAIESSFGGELAFGTGGMRGLIGPGQNRFNRYIVRRATQGLADYINSLEDAPAEKKVAIAYDTRQYSREFADDAALTLAANGITALLFDGVRPTPELSFAVRELGCAAGIVITASHNPPEYNGYKVYGPDGGQGVPPMIDDVAAAIARLDLFDDVRTVSREEALGAGLLQFIGPEIDEAYLNAIRSLSQTRPQGRLKVVFTPLHGTGGCQIPTLLQERPFVELYPVAEQMVPDPQFATVRVPNPEDPAAYKLALELARRREAAIVMATDPDADRVGCAVRTADGEYRHLNGNEIGALLLDYLLGRLSEKGELPEKAVLIKTIVTGDLGRKVAAAYGVETMETLTGFKYIGEKMTEFAESGAHNFIFGYEESYGFLAGTYARDKDAVLAAYLIAEMAAYHQERGRDLLQALEELFRRHGYYREDLISIELTDMAAAAGIISNFEQIPATMAGERVVEKRDYEERKSWDLLGGTEQPLELPRSKVLYYRLESGAWFCIRPSGTEPKIKLYLSVTGSSAAETERKLHTLKTELQTLT
ncbi:MAG: mannose-1-phosphate guanylyltransferase/mannose-6-phosphate isomerase [Firmicutes bacterium]|nr:mannose-1-phosphate guanylyltransferase/mannose-6-phosphate isomerase [Bacillota bacterium]